MQHRSIFDSSRTVDSSYLTADPHMDSTGNNIQDEHTFSTFLKIGEVIRSSPVTYDYDVLVDRHTEWKCTRLTNSSNPDMGTSGTSEYLEGTRVMVALLDPENHIGVILGAIPLPPDADAPVPTSIHPRTHLEGGTALDDTYIETYMSDSRTYKQASAYGRPMDTIPGETHITDSRYGSRVSVYGPIAEVAGGPLSKITTSSLDDTVSIHADTLKKVSATGDSVEYDDGGLTSQEEEVSTYKHERLGSHDIDADPFEPRVAKWLKGFLSKIMKKVCNLKSITRMRVFKGYLGGVFHAIISVPGTESHLRGGDPDNSDKGVFAAHVGEDGTATLRSAAGLSLVLTRKIPVPQRKKFPWDATGAMANRVNLESSKPYEYFFSGDEPRSANAAELRDADKYKIARAYEPFVKLGGDFDILPPAACPDLAGEEVTDRTSKREYDYGSSEVFANINMDTDGGIVLCGGNGCEITMKNGIIAISAPKGIFMSSGEDIVQLAGKDSIFKAFDNIEMVSTNKDIRVKAEKNIHVVAASDLGGNIILESKSRIPVSAAGYGTDASGSGIILKCDEGEVAVTSNKTSINSDDVAIKSEDTVLIDSDNIVTIGKDVTITDGRAVTGLRGGEVRIGGSSVVLEGDSDLALIKGGTTPKIEEWESASSRGVTKDAESKIKDLEEQRDIQTDIDEEFAVTYIGEYSTTIPDNLMSPDWHTNKNYYGYDTEEEWEETELEETMPWPASATFNVIASKDDDDDSSWDDIQNNESDITKSTFDKYPRLKEAAWDN